MCWKCVFLLYIKWVHICGAQKPFIPTICAHCPMPWYELWYHVKFIVLFGNLRNRQDLMITWEGCKGKNLGLSYSLYFTRKYRSRYKTYIVHIYNNLLQIWGPFYLNSLTEIPAWDRYTCLVTSGMKLYYPFSNFNSVAIEVWDCISYFTQ